MAKKLDSFSVTAGMEEVLEAVEDVNTRQFHHMHIITKMKSSLHRQMSFLQLSMTKWSSQV
jgi:hypothetical protein